MLESIVRDYLISRGFQNVFTAKPKEGSRPESYIVIERTGGAEGPLGPYTVALQSYGKTQFEAAELNEAVLFAMRQMPDYADVTKAEYVTDYYFPNTTTKEERYQMVFNIYYRRINA